MNDLNRITVEAYLFSMLTLVHFFFHELYLYAHDIQFVSLIHCCFRVLDVIITFRLCRYVISSVFYFNEILTNYLLVFNIVDRLVVKRTIFMVFRRQYV